MSEEENQHNDTFRPVLSITELAAGDYPVVRCAHAPWARAERGKRAVREHLATTQTEAPDSLTSHRATEPQSQGPCPATRQGSWEEDPAGHTTTAPALMTTLGPLVSR